LATLGLSSEAAAKASDAADGDAVAEPALVGDDPAPCPPVCSPREAEVEGGVTAVVAVPDGEAEPDR
jgi:hypothetical protein